MPGDNIYPDLSNDKFDIQYARLLGLSSDLQASLVTGSNGPDPVIKTPDDNSTGFMRFAVASEDDTAGENRQFDWSGFNFMLGQSDATSNYWKYVDADKKIESYFDDGTSLYTTHRSILSSAITQHFWETGNYGDQYGTMEISTSTGAFNSSGFTGLFNSTNAETWFVFVAGDYGEMDDIAVIDLETSRSTTMFTRAHWGNAITGQFTSDGIYFQTKSSSGGTYKGIFIGLDSDVTLQNYPNSRDDGAVSSGSTKLVYVDANGKLQVGTATFSAGSGTINSGLQYKAAYYITNPSGTVIDDWAGVNFGQSNLNTQIVSQATTEVVLELKAITSQSANIINISSSSGTGDIASLTSAGQLTLAKATGQVLYIGNSSISVTATPTSINMGGTISDAYGSTPSQLKIKLWDGGGSSICGIGIGQVGSLRNMEYVADSALGGHTFWVNGVTIFHIFKNEVRLSDLSASSSTNPPFMGFGTETSSVAGQNPKIRLFNGGGGTSSYGFGVSAGQLDYMVPSSSNAHVFYNAGVERMRVGGTNIDVTITASAATDVLLRLKFATSQSANAFEINSSSGSSGDIFRIDSSGILRLAEVSAPASPASGFGYIYPKNDGKIYYKASGGTEYDLTDNGGGGGYTNLTQFVAQTAWRVFYSDGSGDVQELALGTSGQYLKSNGATNVPSWDTPATGFTTADNGLTASSATNVQLGGTLLADTTIDATSAYQLKITGSKTGAGSGVFRVEHSGTSGAAIAGITSASSSGSSGLYGSATSGVGITGISDNGIAAELRRNASTTNDAARVATFIRQSTGTPADGIGGFIDLWAQNATSGSNSASYLAWEWMTAAFATRTSRVRIGGVTSGATEDWLILGQSGFMQLRGMNVTEAGAITAANGMIVYVTNTDATFTAVGFWGRENGAWVKL